MRIGSAIVLVVAVIGLTCLLTPAQAFEGDFRVRVSADKPVTVALTSGARVVARAVVPVGDRGCLLRGIQPGSYTLIASAPGYHSFSYALTAVAGTSTVGFVRLEKFTGQDYKTLGRAVGFVKNAAGAPVNNARLMLLKGKTPVGVATSQSKNGVYELEWYRPGVYTVLVIAKGYKAVDYHGVELRTGKSTRLNPVLTPK